MMQHQPQSYQNSQVKPKNSQRQAQHLSPRSSLNHTEPPDSDDGGFSGDDGENDYDHHHESTRQGKRKRPISVSYVHCTLLSLTLAFHLLGRLGVRPMTIIFLPRKKE